MKLLFQAACALPLLLGPAALRAQTPAGPGAFNKALLESMSSGSAPRLGNWEARAKRIYGEVRVRSSGSGKWEVLESEVPLAAPYFVKTADSVAEIYLDDRGVIFVGRNTELEVSALARSGSVFILKFGSVAAKLLNFQQERLKMQIRTPSAECSVRGTEFAIEYSRLLKITGVAVFEEGSVSVSIPGPKGGTPDEYLLKKNTELWFRPGQKRFRLEPLSGMARYRNQIIGMRGTLPSLRNTWKRGGDVSKEAATEKPLKADAELREKTAPVPAGKSKRAARVKKMTAGDAVRESAQKER